MTRLGIFVLSATITVIGAIILIIGGVIFAGAHVIKPVEVDGSLTHAVEVTSSGSYDHSYIQIAGDSNEYTYNKNDFQPAVPNDVFFKDAPVNLWVDQGTTNVIAIQLYDENNQNPTMYVTNDYTHRSDALASGHTTGEIVGGMGALLLLFGLAWTLFPWGQQSASKKQAVPAQGAYLLIQSGYPPQWQGTYPPMQPGYPPMQPGYPPMQPGYPPQEQGAYGQPGYPPQGQGAYPPQGQPGYGQPGQPSQGGWGQQPPQG